MDKFRTLPKQQKKEAFKKYLTKDKPFVVCSNGVMIIDSTTSKMIRIITGLRSKKSRHLRKRVKKFITDAIIAGIKESRK